MENIKAKERLLVIFFKAIKGDELSVKNLALKYAVSEKTISRDINYFKNFLVENRDLTGYSELEYSYKEKYYTLQLDYFLSNKQLFVITKIILGSRSLNRMEVLT